MEKHYDSYESSFGFLMGLVSVNFGGYLTLGQFCTNLLQVKLQQFFFQKSLVLLLKIVVFSSIFPFLYKSIRFMGFLCMNSFFSLISCKNISNRQLKLTFIKDENLQEFLSHLVRSCNQNHRNHPSHCVQVSHRLM